MEGCVVAVLGGSGFVGRHVVAQLLDAKPAVKEIRVLDIRTYKPLAEPPPGAETSVVFQRCDILEEAELKEALSGVKAVINCAAATPDFKKEDLGYNQRGKRVNIEGVKNLVTACHAVGVRVLVYTSTADVVMGGARLLDHTEPLTPEVKDSQLLLGDYAIDRRRAEEVVLAAHGSTAHDGGILQTVVLRPPLLYGEGDHAFVPVVLRLARAGGDRLPSIGNPGAFLQIAYVGNIAFAHVCAMSTLLSGKQGGLQDCGGLPVYVTDHTPPNTFSVLSEPFLEHLHLKPARQLPYWLVYLLLLLATLWTYVWSHIGFACRPSSMPTFTFHRYAGSPMVISRMRAELCIGYSPLYSWPESKQRANSYYSKKVV